MTDPTDVTSSARWRLRLSDGDTIELRPAPESGDGQRQSEIVLTMPAWRANDLATVLDRYARIARIFQESSDVWTEDSLVHGLRDASAAATGTSGAAPGEPARVGAVERGRAMVQLQQARPDLTHDQLVAVVDAAAWWFDNGEDYKVTDLLDSVLPDDGASGAVYLTLLGPGRGGSQSGPESRSAG